MEKVDVLAIALIIVVFMFNCYVYYLKEWIKSQHEAINAQADIIHKLIDNDNNTVKLFNKQRELNVAISEFNKSIHNRVNEIESNISLRGVAEPKGEA